MMKEESIALTHSSRVVIDHDLAYIFKFLTNYGEDSIKIKDVLVLSSFKNGF